MITVFLDSEEAKNSKVGDNVTLRLSDSSEISASIEYKKEQDDRKPNVNI